MLEKIGLPAKPSLRGSAWVVDASHCQGCSSQFTFINRKHHCRRCGGIFCNSCTQQRMVLRGQGDSPVRICEPCKKLEEAARFEMRHGYKNRAAKGGSKKKEDDILNQILGNEDKLFSTQKTGSTSSSNIEQVVTQVEGGDIVRNLSLDQPTQMLTEVESATPEDLREQAVVEKKKYKTLKAEGKSEEALRAFKRGKELERQAAALEISLRKNRRKALSSSNTDDIQQIKDHFSASAEKIKPPAMKNKEKDDLSAELKELGWSDVDLRDAEKKPATLTLEGELSSLLREISQKPGKEKQAVSTDRSQVIAHKKRALELKRAGNLIEAKEELKRAKILERKIEEEELLGGADDSDDELSSLMRSIDSDGHDDLLSGYKTDMNFDFNNLLGTADDLGVDGNFEVTDEDMADPEMASALKSLGWADDDAYSDDFHGPVSSSSSESLLTEIQSLKREALNQKRAGNTAEAMALLKKAKVLERELQKNSDSQSVEEPSLSTMESAENVDRRNDKGPKPAPKSKLTIQKELIALKKKALTLRREGRLDESEEELKKAKVLEEQLEELNKSPAVAQPSTGNKQAYTMTHTAADDGDEAEVTDQDLHDPTYLSLLKNLGWEEEDNVKIPSTMLEANNKVSSVISKENVEAPNYASSSSITQSIVNVETGTSRKSKSEIQRELLSLKRKALTLRRQGETEAADEVLENARSLEAQLQEFERPTQREVSSANDGGNASFGALPNTKSSIQVDLHENRTGDSRNQDKVKLEKPEEIFPEKEKLYVNDLSSSQSTGSQLHSSSVQQEISAPKKSHIEELNSSRATDSQTHSSSVKQEILAHKRKALTLKREGKLAEAKEELRLAKLLEKEMEGDASQSSIKSTDAPVSDVSSMDKKETSPSSAPKPLSSRERFKLQQESLSHKRQSLKLRREDDVSIEDFLDPQLLSALQSIGLEDARTTSQSTQRPESTKSNIDNTENVNIEREQLLQQIKAEKVKAVNLKRSGKQSEAMDALRRAKLYEKKLQALTSN
ncbi:Vacuolar protein sorting-associated protein 27 [Sesamum alatum]|uniref:Vacuolar protein sorting-associated protein 27 n=1 Tax=Sesamum alatum TaxID=300844 RepID=A0AAE1Y808_9LAMI|nr:Vacuolar protein sorting-associated protein 27 [Sesamum alatum]